jgi:hypothetical protein
MGYRNQHHGSREDYERPWQEGRWRESNHRHSEDYGLEGEERREYRGRESYEQQTRGGEAGRSGMFDHRCVPRDLDAPYRNNADEDQRGYQDIGQSADFESAPDVDDISDDEDEDDDGDGDDRKTAEGYRRSGRAHPRRPMHS